MTLRYKVQFGVGNLITLERIVQLFEDEAAAVGESEGSAQWWEMAKMCQQQLDNRRGVLRAIRPVYDSLRSDVVQRVAYGFPPFEPLAKGEAREVCRLLSAEGKNAPYIAHRVCTHERTVARWRKQDKEESAAKN